MVVPVDKKLNSEEVKVHSAVDLSSPIYYIETEQVWRIPRPALVQSDSFTIDTTDSFTWELESLEQTRTTMTSPTSFTLLSHPGINGSCGPSPVQLVFTICSLLLLGIVGAVVYMEVYMRQRDA